MQSKKYQLNKADLIAIAEVILWSVSATVVATLITFVAQLDLPAQWMFLVPLANTVLYSLQQFIKDRD